MCVLPPLQNVFAVRYFDIALVARGRLGCGVVACPPPKFSSPVESTPAPQIISITTIADCIQSRQFPALPTAGNSTMRRLHHQVSLPETSTVAIIWLFCKNYTLTQNLPLNLHSHYVTTPSQPVSIFFFFFIFQYFNLYAMQLSQTLQARIVNAGK